MLLAPGAEALTSVEGDGWVNWSSLATQLADANFCMNQMVMRLRVEYAYDSESRNWSFRVPSLGIVGGADTREDAERKVVEAVAFTLEGDDDGLVADTEVRYLNVEIAAS